MIILGIFIGILALAFLVTAHEFGHFLMARKNGVTVKEFGICFPPRAIAWVKGKDGKWHKIPKSDWQKPQKSLVISLNYLPIGGFCAMDGESDADTKKGTFGASTFWAKTKILFGGVLANWLIAIVIFTILAWTGMPHFLNNQFQIDSDTRFAASEPVTIEKVIEGSPAAAAGFEVGDQILKVNGESVTIGSDVTSKNDQLAGTTVEYEISRAADPTNCRPDGDPANCLTDTKYPPRITKTLTATLNQPDADYLLGVSMQSGQAFAYSTWSAPLVGLGTTIQITGETFKGLGDMVWNFFSGIARQISPDASTREAGQHALEDARDSVSGPVGIIGYLFPNMVNHGPSNLFFLIAIISVSLACMNVLPIPALDGGRWFLITLFRARGKKLEKATEERIVSRAMYALLILIVLITVLDIIRFF